VDGGGFVPVAPTRVVDTRGGYGNPSTSVPAGGYVDASLSRPAGVPYGATAVFANITAVGAASDGYFRVATPDQTNSVVNPIARYAANENNATALVARVTQDGRIRVYNNGSGSVDLIVDVQGYFTADGSDGGGFTSSLGRVLDTRNATAIPANGQLTFSIGG
jgi:hypothetical protein